MKSIATCLLRSPSVSESLVALKAPRTRRAGTGRQAKKDNLEFGF